MAKSPDPAAPAKPRKGGNLLVWILMGLLIASLGGFGVTNFNGSVGSVGSVGDRRIEVTDYARALRQEMDAFSAQIGQPVTFAQAQAIGLDRRVREGLVTTAALDNEAARVGLSVGDARVAAEIMGLEAFQGVTGAFDRETYSFTLERNDMTEATFETRIREDLSRSLLQGAVVGGFTAPAPVVATLQAWLGERRGFSLLRLTEADLPDPVSDPSEADLQAYYEANPDAFTALEARRITYAALLPEMLTDEVQVDEAALRAAYDARIDEFVQPERRLVERLVFPTDAEAEAARARLDAGESFETLVAERGLSLPDVDLGEQSLADLGAAGEAVFARTEPGVAGPLPSDLGPALYRMNGILNAQETPFEEARDILAPEQLADAARRAIAGRIDQIDDLLAGGATLEDLEAEAGMQLGTVDYAPGVDAPMVGYAAFRAAAEAIGEGDFPEVIELEDGGIVALRLDEVIPPTLRPFDEVAQAVTEGWRASAVTSALAARAAEVQAAVEGGASLGGFGIVDVTQSMPRDGFIEGAPETLLSDIFRMEAGALQVVASPELTGVVRLDSIQPADPASPEAVQVRDALDAQLAQQIAQDAFTVFANALTSEAGVALDEAALNAVHAQIQ